MPQPTPAQLGAAIRRLRKSRKWSMETLSFEADVHVTSVSEIENGKRDPRWMSIVKLAGALEVDMSDLARLAAEQPAPDS